MSNTDKIDWENTSVDEADDVTTTRGVREARAILEEATTITEHHQIDAPHVSWARRLLSWFKRD